MVGVVLGPVMARAQNIVSGEVTGTVTDPTGAVVPEATVTLSSSDTGFTNTQTTGPTGTFRFSLVKPGNYTLTVTAPRFSKVENSLIVQTGQAADIPVRLAVGSVSETIQVETSEPLLQTDNANIATTISSTAASEIPNPGQDITNLALLTDGVSVSTGGAYGNFSSYGVGGTSNLFTVNGADYNDPDNNLQNSGASNMTLGTNELQELTVVENGYTGQYGRAAGANLNYSTKSGTNSFHGNAIWYWNGSKLNANDFFSNASGSPRQHAVSNQWAGSVGGPIVKNKLFFFYNNEGSRYVLPGGGGTIFTPTAAFATAVQNHLAAVSAPAAVQSFYKTMFSLYAGAPGSSIATPVSFASDSARGCGDFSGSTLGGVTFGGAAGVACAQQFQSAVNGLNLERIMSLTIDWVASDNDAIKVRWKQDRGVQATATDPINSAFSANSVQPEWDAEVNWTHTINSRMINQLILSGLHYGAIFGPPNFAAALATFPTSVLFNDGAPFTTMGGGIVSHELFNYPSGRDVGTYQIVDDFSIVKGDHAFKFGLNFRRDNLSDFSAGQLTSGEVVMASITDFTNGVISSTPGHDGTGQFLQNFANSNDVPEKNYTLGVYVQDEWKVTSHLKLTLATRFERNSPVSCNTNCFTRFTSQFSEINHSALVPYSQSLALNSSSAMKNVEKVVFGPRVGFAWTPGSSQSLVIRGGVGIFPDLYPLYLASRFFTNLPNVSSFTVSPNAANNNIPIAPGAPNSVFAQAAASNTALHNAILNGGTLASVQAAVAPLTFALPNFFSITDNLLNPKYLEWSLNVEKTFGSKTAIGAGYIGRHGYDLILQNYGENTYCTPPPVTIPPTPPPSAACSNGPLGNLPTSAPDPRFARVNEITNNGRSNYDGVTFSVKQKVTKGLTGGATFTYSHSLDNISNGGFFQFSLNAGGDSIRYQINPQNPNSPGYGNSDYDFRHTFSAYYVWALPFKAEGPVGRVIGGWTVSGVVISRGGEPFSVYNTGIRSSIGNGTSLTPLAVYLGGPMTCSRSAVTTPCLSKANFATTATQQNYPGGGFGNISRNSFRGPGYFDTDFTIAKDIPIRESMVFTVGANAFNVLNHANFGNPTASLTSGSFGSILNTVGSPNSPYGNFTGAIVNGRIIQLEAKFKF
jgi:hypothetical protein